MRHMTIALFDNNRVLPQTIAVNCKEISAMMRATARSMAALQHVQDGPSHFSSVSSLQSQTQELVSALDKLTHRQLLGSVLRPEHTCFIHDFINLLTALVSQMVRLEHTATSSSIPLQDDGFDRLWSLLYSGSRAFRWYPYTHQMASLWHLTPCFPFWTISCPFYCVSPAKGRYPGQNGRRLDPWVERLRPTQSCTFP